MQATHNDDIDFIYNTDSIQYIDYLTSEDTHIFAIIISFYLDILLNNSIILI